MITNLAIKIDQINCDNIIYRSDEFSSTFKAIQITFLIRSKFSKLLYFKLTGFGEERLGGGGGKLPIIIWISNIILPLADLSPFQFKKAI